MNWYVLLSCKAVKKAWEAAGFVGDVVKCANVHDCRHEANLLTYEANHRRREIPTLTTNVQSQTEDIEMLDEEVNTLHSEIGKTSKHIFTRVFPYGHQNTFL